MVSEIKQLQERVADLLHLMESHPKGSREHEDARMMYPSASAYLKWLKNGGRTKWEVENGIPSQSNMPGSS